MIEVRGLRLEATNEDEVEVKEPLSKSEFIMKIQASAMSSLYMNSRRGLPVPQASTNTLEVGGLRLEAENKGEG
jgi:hypothetical protein